MVMTVGVYDTGNENPFFAKPGIRGEDIKANRKNNCCSINFAVIFILLLLLNFKQNIIEVDLVDLENLISEFYCNNYLIVINLHKFEIFTIKHILLNSIKSSVFLITKI